MIPPGVQEKRKKLGGRSAPWVLKGPKSAGLNRVKGHPEPFLSFNIQLKGSLFFNVQHFYVKIRWVQYSSDIALVDIFHSRSLEAASATFATFGPKLNLRLDILVHKGTPYLRLNFHLRTVN